MTSTIKQIRDKLESKVGARNYFVLIAADSDRNRVYMPSAFDLARYRLSRNEWGLKARTRYRTHMKSGDQLLIYLSGCRERAQHFIAEATIDSAPVKNLGALVDAPNIANSICSEFKVSLKNVRIFRRPVCARDLLDDFRFVAPRHRKIWRIYFQGGAIRLPREDYALVLRREKQQTSK